MPTKSVEQQIADIDNEIARLKEDFLKKCWSGHTSEGYYELAEALKETRAGIGKTISQLELKRIVLQDKLKKRGSIARTC